MSSHAVVSEITNMREWRVNMC